MEARVSTARTAMIIFRIIIQVFLLLNINPRSGVDGLKKYFDIHNSFVIIAIILIIFNALIFIVMIILIITKILLISRL